MKWVALAFLTLILSTFFSYSQKNENSIDPLFSEFLESFILEGRKYGIDLQKKASSVRINFGELGKNKAGSCKKYSGYSQVTIYKSIWEKMDSLQKQVLIFHELGHCLLGRKHRNDRLPRGECASLLVESQNQNSCFCNFYSQEWKEYYLRELFTRKVDLPQWYWKDTALFLQGVKPEIVMDTTGSRSLTLYETDSIVTDNHQSTFYLPKLERDSKALIYWQSLRITFDPKMNVLAIDTHVEYPSFLKKIPRLFYTRLSQRRAEEITVRTYKGYYDIFVNGNHIYKTKADFPMDKNQHVLLFTLPSNSTRSHKLRVKLSNLIE